MYELRILFVYKIYTYSRFNELERVPEVKKWKWRNTSLSENVKLYVDMFDHGTTIYVFICGGYCIQAISKLKTLS